jgi:transglutaminase-like putative cysteine protease
VFAVCRVAWPRTARTAGTGHLPHRGGRSTALSSAADVNLARCGVCRDFTHLAVSFCRALNIPARYVFGYLPDLDVPPDPAPMDFAA